MGLEAEKSQDASEPIDRAIKNLDEITKRSIRDNYLKAGDAVNLLNIITFLAEIPEALPEFTFERRMLVKNIIRQLPEYCPSLQVNKGVQELDPVFAFRLSLARAKLEMTILTVE